MAEKDSFFATLLTTNVALEAPSDGRLFIDRDPTHFRHILNWLRSRAVPLLPLPELHELVAEAEFYRLTEFRAALEQGKLRGAYCEVLNWSEYMLRTVPHPGSSSYSILSCRCANCCNTRQSNFHLRLCLVLASLGFKRSKAEHDKDRCSAWEAAQPDPHWQTILERVWSDLVLQFKIPTNNNLLPVCWTYLAASVCDTSKK